MLGDTYPPYLPNHNLLIWLTTRLFFWLIVLPQRYWKPTGNLTNSRASTSLLISNAGLYIQLQTHQVRKFAAVEIVIAAKKILSKLNQKPHQSLKLPKRSPQTSQPKARQRLKRVVQVVLRKKLERKKIYQRRPLQRPQWRQPTVTTIVK